MILTRQAIPAVFDGTAYNNNLTAIENGFTDLGPYVISGLVPSAGTGLSVNVTAGTASIGGRVTMAAGFTIGGLADNTVNHLYLLQAGTGTSNTTGTAAANSVKLGTATTAAGAVTSVNTLRSSGRQLFVRPDALVPGAVGSPGSINLAGWAAAAGDNVPVFGTLPAGAVGSGSLTAPVTITRGAVTATSPPPLLTVTGAADTALTAATEANALLLDFSATRQWATGALTTQRAMWVRSPTYGFVGASTLTNAATLAIEGAPAAGANATITNPMALWVQGGNTVLAGNLGVGAGSNNPASTLVVNAGTRNAPAQGILLAVSCSPDTNRFAGIEYFDLAISAAPASIQWATGAITRQRFSWFRQNTMAFVGGSTVADAATLAIEGAPVAGTNATLTRTMALWVQAGAARFDGNVTLGAYNATARLHLPAGSATASTAPLKLTTGPLLTAPEAGALEFLTPTLYAAPVTTRRTLMLASDTITAGATVANTLTETLLGTATIAANELSAGKAVKVRVLGRYSTANSTDTLTIRFRLNTTAGTVLGALTVVSTAATVTNAAFDCELLLVCRTTGGTGTVHAFINGEVNNVSKASAATTTTTVDTTTAENIVATATWSNALAGNTVTAEQFYAEFLGG